MFGVLRTLGILSALLVTATTWAQPNLAPAEPKEHASPDNRDESLVASSPTYLNDGGADDCCPNWLKDCGCCQPTWIVRAGGIILNRSAPRDQPIFVDATTGAQILNANQFDFGWTGGPDVTLMRRLADDTYLEIRHFNVSQWNSTRSFDLTGPFEIPAAEPIFAPFDAIGTAAYTSRLFSTEVNLRRVVHPRITLLAGFRWIELHDNLFLNANLSVVDVNGSLRFNTDNHLYGGQVGIDTKLWDRGGPFRLEGIFKAGLLGNAADQSASNISSSQFGSQSLYGGRSKSQIAFVGDIAITAVYQLSKNVSLRGGYQLLWIDGVALASDQISVLNFDAGSGIHTTGGVFYHGALAGIEFRR